MEVTGWVAKIIRDEKPAKVNIDVGGLGVGVYDRLIEQGHSRSVVNAVNFGGKPIEPAPLREDGKPAGGPANRRAEMWGNLKKALESEAGFSLPDSDSLQADLVGPGYKYNSSGQLVLESKDDMRRRGPTKSMLLRSVSVSRTVHRLSTPRIFIAIWKTNIRDFMSDETPKRCDVPAAPWPVEEGYPRNYC
jgi:hypothetical protein